VHGQEHETTLGGRKVLLYPLYHPAAALYTPAMLKVLESDFARLPGLLGEAEPAPLEALPEPEPNTTCVRVCASAQRSHPATMSP